MGSTCLFWQSAEPTEPSGENLIRVLSQDHQNAYERQWRVRNETDKKDRFFFRMYEIVFKFDDTLGD
jgi:hypothetical protein